MSKMMTLDDAVIEVLRRLGEAELYDFMDELRRFCWRNGVVCLKWVIDVEGDRIRRICTDAWELILRLARRGVIDIRISNGRVYLSLAEPTRF